VLPERASWLALVGLGLGPVGTAFLLWDIGMKGGSVPLLGVLSYASPILSTALLVALGLAQASASLALACALMVAAAVIATRPELTGNGNAAQARARPTPHPTGQSAHASRAPG